MALRRKIEVAAIVAEAVIFCIYVFPSPILRGEFAVHGVLLGDIVAIVIVKRPREQPIPVYAANLYELENLTVKGIYVFMCRNKDSNVRMSPQRKISSSF